MMFMPGTQPDYLPQSIKELIDVIGHKATELIVKEYGGIVLCVPVNYKADHPLNEIIGKKALEQLIEHYQGEQIEIANCKTAMQKKRMRDIATAKANGASTFELAKQYGLTARRIRMIQQEMSHVPDNPQTELF